jgi:hypothetical protein
MYRGDIPPNSTVNVKLSTDSANSGSAIMMVGTGAFGGQATGTSVVVAPGGSGSRQVKSPAAGILKVFVDFADDDDSGRLDLSAPGGFTDGDEIAGDTVWTYSA